MKLGIIGPVFTENFLTDHDSSETSSGSDSIVEFADRTLKCKDCKQTFSFAGDEVQAFAERGLMHPPSRCPQCRETRAAKMATSNRSGRDTSGFGERTMYTVTCAECGKEARVPFEPKADRPVYCRDCYANHRTR